MLKFRSLLEVTFLLHRKTNLTENFHKIFAGKQK